jgi:hypothetical protein
VRFANGPMTEEARRLIEREFSLTTFPVGNLSKPATEPRHLLFKVKDREVRMPSPAVHRRWAREFLAKAETAASRNRKLKYLRLAVDNTLRARKIEQVERPETKGTTR